MTRRQRGEAHPCPGQCGKMVRPQRGNVADFPGTVKRYTGGYCRQCNPGTAVVVDTRPDIRPCIHCGTPTRPTRISAAEAPGARIRVGDLCRVCDNACATVDPSQEALVAHELDLFFRARRRRGIPAEGIKVGA